MASIQDRYGTEAEHAGDKQDIQTIWKYSPTSYDNEKIVVLPYAMQGVISLGVGTGAYQQFKINSVYDPDLTGAGFQPLGRDTWASIYDYYKVLEAHVSVTMMEHTNSVSADPSSVKGFGYYGLMADITANPPDNISKWLMTKLAAKNGKQQKFTDVQLYDPNNGRGQKPLKFEYHWDASQFDTSIIDNAKNEWTPVGSDPANLNYLSLLYSIGSIRSVNFYVEIEYLCAFKQVNRSLLNTIN